MKLTFIPYMLGYLSLFTLYSKAQTTIPDTEYEIELKYVVTQTTAGVRANSLGNAAQRAEIHQKIATTLAPLNCSVKFPLADETWVSDYAYRGAGTGERVATDLDVMFDSIPLQHYQVDSGVITVVFCDRVPGFEQTGPEGVNGVAYVGWNGIAYYLGSNLLETVSGRESIASILAHEIGHNLGLPHSAISNNLMATSGITFALEPHQTALVNDARFDYGFLAKKEGVDIRLRQYQNSACYVQYLRSTQGPTQLVGSLGLSDGGWQNLETDLGYGMYFSGVFDYVNNPQIFFQVEPATTLNKSNQPLKRVPRPAYVRPALNCKASSAKIEK